MKVKASLKLICPDCYFVRRGKNLFMRCNSNPRHKRRQGFSTLNYQPSIDIPAEHLQNKFSLHTLPTDSQHSTCHHCKKAMSGPLQLNQIVEI